MLDFLKGNVGTGLLLGVGALILAPVVLPVLGSILKSATKAVVKTGAALYEIGSDAAGEVGKIVEDFVAETKAESAGEGESAEAESVAGVEQAVT